MNSTVSTAVPPDRRFHFIRLMKYSKEALAANLACSFPGPSYHLLDAIDAASRAKRAHRLHAWLYKHSTRAGKIIRDGVKTSAQIDFIKKYARTRKQFDALVAKIDTRLIPKKVKPS